MKRILITIRDYRGFRAVQNSHRHTLPLGARRSADSSCLSLELSKYCELCLLGLSAVGMLAQGQIKDA